MKRCQWCGEPLSAKQAFRFEVAASRAEEDDFVAPDELDFVAGMHLLPTCEGCEKSIAENRLALAVEDEQSNTRSQRRADVLAFITTMVPKLLLLAAAAAMLIYAMRA